MPDRARQAFRDRLAWWTDHVLLDYFFFQAEDGIRDLTVTGVQTCALPICQPLWLRLRSGLKGVGRRNQAVWAWAGRGRRQCRCTSAGRERRRGNFRAATKDRKSTRLNSSHSQISYAVFCLQKKKNYKVTPY